MSAAYAAFEGYGEEDVQAEMEVYYTDDDEHCGWSCLVPPFFR